MRAINIHTGNSKMRVGSRVAVARKVLNRGQHPAFMRAFDIGGNQIAHLLWIFSKRARVDDGIRGIRIYVGIRKEIPVHPDGAGLFAVMRPKFSASSSLPSPPKAMA